ncbi:MAG: hypothetical protein HYY06_25140 [Deltaproteobacteria bacterium]|nr:hypothetical protein [Deltaproteobacteria bacterium]
MATRLVARAEHLEGWDGVDFALALEDFDLERYQPHFPGYPVFVGLARLLAPLAGPGPADALTLPGAIVCGAAAWALWRLGGRGAALLYLAAPGLWLVGGKPLSDGLGLGLLLFAFALARTRPATSGLLAALTLGVRLSYAPAVLAWGSFVLASRCSYRRSAVGFGIGVGAWLVPLVLLAGGPFRLVEIGSRFAQGHFGRWGGAAGYLGLGQRLARQAWGLFDWTLGTVGPGDVTPLRIVTTLALVIALVGALRHRAARLALLFCLPYLIWALVAQNPDRPRHLAPVAAALIIALGSAPRWCALAATSMVLTALPLVRLQATTPPPDTALAMHVAREWPGARIYGWDTVRLFAVYGPSVDARRAVSLDDVAREEATGGRTPVLFTSDLRGKRRTRHCFELVATFRSDPHVFPPRRGLTLFRTCGASVHADSAVLHSASPWMQSRSFAPSAPSCARSSSSARSSWTECSPRSSRASTSFWPARLERPSRCWPRRCAAGSKAASTSPGS